MPLACIPNAIPNRPRYIELRQKLRAAITVTQPLENGQSWRLSEEIIKLTESAEWIEMERLCCPFLQFKLETNAEQAHTLTLSGPPGTSEFFANEFR